MNLFLLPDLLCLALCITGAVTDVRWGRLPNWLTGSGVAAGLVLNPVCTLLMLDPSQSPLLGLVSGFMAAAVGCLLLLITFGLMAALKFLRWGDVKMMAAVGALLRWPAAVWALAYVGIAGGVVALFYALYKGRLGHVFRNIYTIGSSKVRRDDRAREVQLHGFPYGVAILIGAAWAAAANWFPVLRIP